MNRKIIISIVICFFGTLLNGQEGQIEINRIGLMPDQPSPYNMRDWAQVAINYDRFTYDLNKNGTFLPLINIVQEGKNYPQRSFYSQPTYVGSENPLSGEAINILPGLVGASLMGIDKSSQDGNNYLLMAQDFYNKANGENLYLNSNSTKSGNDWWYDMMPNVFFYQLYDLHPDMGGESSEQFISIAELMLEAVDSMGGGAAPWSIPYMNYRAWQFLTMEPKAEGVPEPEAAGAFSWLLYHAYKKTGLPKYRIGAEWAMEFLNSLNANPSYELQLPYGTYVAAKMNAEEGTKYDIEKMVNWSFDKGSLRGWGTIVDTWSGIDVSGLVGESESDTDYAFQLNGIQQAAALVPMVRYDKRFAKSIAKWVLNLANANRLFYHSFLPASLQDASDWSEANDPNRVIGYEAMREDFNGLSPYSTGDAVKGGWAETNLALYGTSSIGYLGSMISKTNIDKILKIDLLKTDFYREQAYPTYLFFNSYESEKVVTLYAGTEIYDIYDPINEQFIAKEVTGAVPINIQGFQVVMPTIVPSGGIVSFKKNKMLIDNVIVDYAQSQEPYSNDLRIKAVAAKKALFSLNETIDIHSTVEYEGDPSELSYSWLVNGENQSMESDILTVQASTIGEYEVQLIVRSPEESDSSSFKYTVTPKIEEAPVIQSLEISRQYSAPGLDVMVNCVADDPNGDALIFDWSVSGGTFVQDSSEGTWTLPDMEGVYSISVIVSDSSSLTDFESSQILVKVFESADGELVAHYPLATNGDDISGNKLDGILTGGVSTLGYDGGNNEAYFFNGSTHFMEVENDPLLNFTEAITISFWMKPDVLPERESFLISHGSWQNRWKASITPDRRLRWTINTQSSIADLDSRKNLTTDSFIHATLSYDGQHLMMYVNGELESFTSLSGNIRTTSFPMLLAQSLPDEQAYNYRGVLDEVRIYDFALTPDQVKNLYSSGDITSTITDPLKVHGLQIFPNPTRGLINITFDDGYFTDCLAFYDANGRLLLKKKVSSQLEKIDLQAYPAGLYYIKSMNANKVQQTIRIIKY